MRAVMCVAFMERTDSWGGPGTKGWCAARRKLDPKAWSDETLCGHFVTLRIGSGEREPTCKECIAIMAAR